MADLARIKRNVAKMASQDAPIEDIDGYIASEGVSIDDVRNFRAAPAEPAAAKEDRPNPGGWTPHAEADLAEKITGTGSMADATGSGIAKAVPFGDEIVSGLNAPFRAGREWLQGDGFDVGRAYDRNMQLEAELQRRREERSPIASTVGAVAGGLGAGSVAARGGLSFLNGAKPTLASMAGRGAAEGATYGALYGAGEGRGIEDRGYNAMFGAGIGLLTGGATGALGSVGAQRAAKSVIPGLDDLRAAGQAAYKQADDAGLIFTPQAVERLKMDVGQKLVKMGYDPALQPGAAAVVRRIDDLEGQNVTLTGLDSLRKVASNGYQMGNKSNNKAVGDIVASIDNLISSPKGSEILTGDPKAAWSALSKARDMWSRLSKAERLEYAVNKAKLRAASTGSGGNEDNAIRQNARRLLESERGWTKQERVALQAIVKGTPVQNALRLLGKLSPSGNGLMAALGVGGAMMNPALGAASLAGMGAKSIADGLTHSNTRALDTIIRNGGQAINPQLSAIRQGLVGSLARGSAQQLPASTRR